MYNNIQKGSELSVGSNYHLFKQGIKPMWEDPANAKGGRWTLMVNRRNRNHLDDMWLKLCLAVIGEAFGEGNRLITGMVLSPRAKSDRICVWVGDCSPANLELLKAMGTRLREVMELPNDQTLSFADHDAPKGKDMLRV